MGNQSNLVNIDARTPDPDLVSLTEAEKLWGIKRQTIERLIKDESIVPQRRGRKYRKDSLASALILYYKGNNSKKYEPSPKEEAEIRLKNAQAYRIELQNDETESKLIPSQDHFDAINSITVAILDELNKAEAEIPEMVAASPEQEKTIAPLVEEWFRKSKQRLSDMFRPSES